MTTFNNKDTNTIPMPLVKVAGVFIFNFEQFFLVLILQTVLYEQFSLCFMLISSIFSQLCLQTRFIGKRQKIDVKIIYLNFNSYKVAGLLYFYTFSGADIK